MPSTRIRYHVYDGSKHCDVGFVHRNEAMEFAKKLSTNVGRVTVLRDRDLGIMEHTETFFRGTPISHPWAWWNGPEDLVVEHLPGWVADNFELCSFEQSIREHGDNHAGLSLDGTTEELGFRSQACDSTVVWLRVRILPQHVL